MISVSPTSIEFEDVAVNDIPSYRTIKISNSEPTEVSIQLSSSTPLLKFQLRNENYELQRNGTLGDKTACYNEMFDMIGLIDTVHLKPLGIVEVVVWFRAEPSAFLHAGTQSPTVLSGIIQLAVTSVPRLSSSTVVSEGHLPLFLHAVRSEVFSIAFSVGVFVSLLQVSKPELQITTHPNTRAVMNFSVTNASCRPLTFVVRNQMLPLKGIDFGLYESDRFEEPKFGHRMLLDAHASMNLSVLAHTKSSATQQYQTTLQCENLRDCRNTTQIPVTVDCAESHGDLVKILDSSLDFGDVYRGIKTMVNVSVVNIDGRDDGVLHLGSLHRKRCEGVVMMMSGDSPVDEIRIFSQKGPQSICIRYQPDSGQKEPAKVKFDLELLVSSVDGCRSQRAVLRCTATLYTSSVVVTPTSVNFGDCLVGQRKQYTLKLENRSPLPGSVVVEIRSKIISIDGAAARHNSSGSRETREEFVIAPSSSLPITLRIAPQRVNPTYRKQLTIINQFNPSDDPQIVNIESNNMAPSEAKLHNELYSWELCDDESLNERGPLQLRAITSVPLIIPYNARSKVDRPITLTIQTTSPEIAVFCAADPARADLDSAALEMRSFCVFGDTEEVSKVMSGPLDAVDKAKQKLIQHLREMVVISRRFVLGPFGSLRIYALIVRQTVAKEPLSKEDGLTVEVEGVEAPRFVRLSYRLCSTFFELSGQKTKNFGEVNIGVRRTTKIPVNNRCESVLYLRIVKSKSVTAGHLRIENSDQRSIILIVRPFATREVELTFHPGIKGKFEEKIHVSNILNPDNSFEVTVKATVTKADTFDVSPDSWSFSNVLVSTGEEGSTRIGARFTVTNTSTAQRDVRMRVDTSGCSACDSDTDAPSIHFEGVDAKVQLEMELCGSSAGSPHKLEEQIEKLEQKLKIYERKKKVEKMEAARKRIEILKRELNGGEVNMESTPDHDLSETDDDTAPTRPRVPAPKFHSHLLRDGVVLPRMSAGESVVLTFVLVCSRLPAEFLPALQTSTINIMLYEAEDQEVNRIIPIDITLVRPEGESGSPTAPAAHDHPVVSTPTRKLLTSTDSLAKSNLRLRIELGDLGLIATTTFMEHQLLVLRNCIVNDVTEFVISASSLSCCDTSIVILEPRRCGGPPTSHTPLDARFQFFPRNGIVDSRNGLRIKVECTPRSVGPQKYFIPVKNLQNASDVRYIVVDLNPTEEEEQIVAEPKLLVFPDVITPCNFDCHDAQLVLIRSRFLFPHALLIRSNRPSQVLLFEDPRCTVPLSNPIQRTFVRETIRVYVVFRPSPKSMNSSARTLRAGILIEAIARGDDQLSVLGRLTVPVSVQVGCGLLRVPSTAVDVGSLSPSEHSATVSLVVRNTSTAYKIRAKFSHASPYVSFPTREDDFGCILQPNEERRVAAVLHMPHPGFFHETVVVENGSCLQDPIAVTISALRQDEAISAVFPVSHAGHAVDSLSLSTAALAWSEDGALRLFNNPTSKSLIIHNHSSRDVLLGCECSFPTVMGPTEHGTMRLRAHRAQNVSFSLSDVPDINPDSITKLLNFELVKLHTTAKVNVVSVADDRSHAMAGQCVLLVPLQISLATSGFHADPSVVDLGIVSQAETEDRVINITLRNLSPWLPLHLRVVCPPILRFPGTTIEIPAGETRVIDATVLLRLLPSQGPFTHVAHFLNEMNPENEMSVRITGKSYRKMFQLSAENQKGNSLSLSALHVHHEATMPSILSELKLNISGTVQSLEADIDVHLTEELKGLLELQLLSYDATPLTTHVVLNSDQRGRTGGDNDPSVGSSTSSGGQGGSRKAQPSQLDHQYVTIRLRCVLLRDNDLASLVNHFTTYQKKQAMKETWTFDRISSVDRNRHTMESSSKWIGSVVAAGPSLDEEYHIFAQLDPFSTFSAPSKMDLKLYTCSTPVGSGSAQRSRIVCAGTLPAKNICHSYATELRVLVLVSEHLAIPVDVHVCCDHDTMGCTHFTNSINHLPASTTTQARTVDVRGELDFGTHSHRLTATAGQEVALRVVISVIDPEPGQTLQQSLPSLLEQFVTVVIVDENIPTSQSITRMSVTLTDDCPPAYLLADQPSTGCFVGDASVSAAPTPGLPELSITASTAGPAVQSVEGTPMDSTAFTADGTRRVGGGAEGGCATPLMEYVTTNSPHAPSTEHPALALLNCHSVPGCVGAYSASFSFAKEDTPNADIQIRNLFSNTPVEYTVSIISQGPQTWLLLPSSSGVLEGGETQPLRLNILSSDVGSFMGYVEIRNNARREEVMYLRLSAEIFVTSSGDGLFEFIATSNGQRVAINAAHSISMGHLYGQGTSRACVTLEIANKSNVALEFPVSVVQPFHIEVKPVQETIPMVSFHARHESIADGPRRSGTFTDPLSEDGGIAPRATLDEVPRAGISSALASVAHPLDLGSELLTQRRTSGEVLAPVETQLVVCHIHGVPTNSGQKYIVVDPNSRVRLAFVLNCLEVRIPRGFGAMCEADVVFKCKQARDANYTFHAKFEIFPPTFDVAREYHIFASRTLFSYAMETHESRAHDHLTGSSPDGSVVQVWINNQLDRPQTVAFRTQSPVLYVTAVISEGAVDEAALAVARGRLQEASQRNAINSLSAAQLELPPLAAGCFLIRLDQQRAAVMLNLDKDNGRSPILCEHAFVLNAHNPRERVKLDFHLLSSQTAGAPQNPADWSTTDATKSSISIALLPMRNPDQRISEHYIVRFAQRFSQTLSQCSDRLLMIPRRLELALSETTKSATTSKAISESSFTAEEELPTTRRGVRTETSDDVGRGARGLMTSDSGQRVAGLNEGEDQLMLFSAMRQTLAELLIDLTWLVDELVWYSIELRNSRLMDGYCKFLAATVANHPVMRSWKKQRGGVAAVEEQRYLTQYLATLEALPCIQAEEKSKTYSRRTEGTE